MDSLTLAAVLLSNATLYLAVRFGPRMVRPALWIRTEPELLMPPEVEAQPPAQPSVPKTRRTFLGHKCPDKTVLEPKEAAVELIDFMNACGQTGTFTADEIRQFWQVCETENDIANIDIQSIWEALASLGHRVGQRRLKNKDYREVWLRSGQDRAVIYTVPKRRRSHVAPTFVPGDVPAIPEPCPDSHPTLPANIAARGQATAATPSTTIAVHTPPVRQRRAA